MHPLEAHFQPSRVIFPCSSWGEDCDFLVVAALGLCSKGSPSMVSLLGLSNLAGKCFLGVWVKAHTWFCLRL